MTTAVNGRENLKLKSEIASLVQYIRRFREEIAQMVERDDQGTRFENISDQLDAIIGATETATHSIIETMEQIDGLVDKIRHAEDQETREAHCDTLNIVTTKALEACTFQDITGQRVTKIVRSMKFVEERVNRMAELWGRDEIEKLAEEISGSKKRTGDEALLNGPALPVENSISQDDIDKLFD